jgi:hypothetical protein
MGKKFLKDFFYFLSILGSTYPYVWNLNTGIRIRALKRIRIRHWGNSNEIQIRADSDLQPWFEGAQDAGECQVQHD